MSRRPFRTSSTFWRSDPSPAPSGSNPARSTERNQATLGDQTDPIQISDSDDEPVRTQNKTSLSVPGPSNRMHTYRQSNIVIGSQHSNLVPIDNHQVMNNTQLLDDVRLDVHGVDGENAIAASPSIDINNGQDGEIMDEADLNAPSDDDENEEEDQVAPSSPRDGKEDEESECESDDKDEEAVSESSDDDEAESELASLRNPPIKSSIKTKQNNIDQRASSSSQPEIYSKARIDELLKAHCPPRNPITFASDDYCWLCHDNFKQYPGFEVVKVVMCYRCKLCWHKKCSDKVFEDKADTLIKKTSQPKYKDNLERKQAWIRDLPSVKDPKICIECARKEAGFVFCVFEGFLKDVDLNNDDVMFRIYTCFKYILYRLKNYRDAEGKQIFKKYKKFDYSMNLVQEQINFGYMREHWYLYRCTEDFMFDIKRLYHNMIVIARDQCIDLYLPKEIANLDLMLTIVTQELEAIDRCDSCHRNYYELDNNMVQNEIWMPCENAHSLVWAPNHDLWWPAKVYEYREKNYFYLSDEFVWIEYFGKINNPKRIRVLKKNSSHVNLHTYARAFPKKSIPISKDNKLKWDKRQKQAIAETEYYHTKYWNQYYNEKYDLPDTSQQFSLDDLFQVVEKINDIKNDPNFVLVDCENESKNLNENEPSTSGKRKASDQQSSSKKNMNAAPSKDSVPKKHSRNVCTCGKKKAPICTVHKHPPN